MFSGFVFLDLRAGVHEILYLRTRWWWLGEALGLWNTATILTQHKYHWLLVSFSLVAPKLTCTSSPCEDLHRSWRVRPRRVKIYTEIDAYVLTVWEAGPKLACTSSPCEDLHRSWRVRPRRVRIYTEVDAYVLTVWEAGPKLTCTSSPCEDLHRSWRVRPRRVKIYTEVDAYVLTVWEAGPKLACTSSPIENFDRSDASRFLRP
jgi:hypothetical protein